MRRDWDLIKSLILNLEDQEESKYSDDWNSQQVGHHYWLLLDAGLITGHVIPIDGQFPIAMPTCLTWKGHEFASLIRDESAWNDLQTRTKNAAGALSFGVAFEVLKSYALSKIGMGT